MTVMPRTLFQKSLQFLPLLVLVTSGCSTLDLSKGLAWPGSDDKPQIPDRIVDVWTDDVLHQSGQPSKRGFGGRFMFYNRESESPVKVEGALTVYLFDDRCEDPLRGKPIHKYIFPVEALEKHYSKSELGHSYSFWLPVDEVGGVERTLTVIARFEPKVGGKVMAKPSTHVLPGRPADEESSPLVQRFEARQYEKKANGEIQQVAHVEPVYGDPASAPETNQGITTATINLPPGFARQMMSEPTQSAFGVTLAPPGTSATGSAAANAASFTSGLPAASSAMPAFQPAQTPEATQAALRPTALPPVGSQLSRFPARREALGRPIASRVRTQPYRATWPSALPTTPRAAPTNESLSTSSADLPSPPPWREQEEW